MSNLADRLQKDLQEARKAQDKPRTLVLGTILSDLKNRQLELNRELTDDDTLEILRRGIKKRRESIEMYTKGGREDLAAKERAEVQTLDQYLPAQAADEEVRAAVRAAIAGGAANVGAVMSSVMPVMKGRADGGRVSAVAREELAKQG